MLRTLKSWLPLLLVFVSGICIGMWLELPASEGAPGARPEIKPAVAKTNEYDLSGDGETDFRSIWFQRGRNQVLSTDFRRNSNGVWVVYRKFVLNGSVMLTELDADNDGIFEKILFHYPDKGWIDGYFRGRSNNVIPLSAKELDVLYEESDRIELQLGLK